MGNAQTQARYKIKKKLDGENLLNTADVIINYHHFSIYFNDTIPPKLKPYIDEEIFTQICDHITEVGSKSRKDLKQIGSAQCNCIGILLVLIIIFILIGIICIDYWNGKEWIGWFAISISLLFLICIIYLFKVNKPNEKLWWNQFLIALRIKIDDINKIFANQLYLNIINFDEETDYSPIQYKKQQQLDPNNTSLFSCRLHFEMIGQNKNNKDEKTMIKLDNLDELKNLQTEIDYDHLDEYRASITSFVTIDDGKEEEKENNEQAGDSQPDDNAPDIEA